MRRPFPLRPASLAVQPSGDSGLLPLAVEDVRADGQRLEGVGVAPTIEVPSPPFRRRRRSAARPRRANPLAQPGTAEGPGLQACPGEAEELFSPAAGSVAMVPVPNHGSPS